MESKQRFVQTYVFSAIGVVGMFVLLVALNVICRGVSKRIDFTAEKLFTLSQGSRAILAKIDTPVTVRFYYSKDATQMPVFLKSYAQRVEDLLKEYREVTQGNLVIQKFNPTPDSDAEDAAHLDGIYGQQIGIGGDEEIYLGLAVSCLDQTVAVPFLSPERENMLEYDITRAVYRVFHAKKTVLGVMSSLPVMGQRANPMMPSQQGNQPPWQVITELKQDFDVREIPTETEEIAKDIDVLLLIHASNLSDKTLFAIDQYVLRGGKLLAFMDPMSLIESQQQNNPMSQFQPPKQGSSTLGKLLDAWGIQFDTDKVVADLEYLTQFNSQGRPQVVPTALSLNADAIASDDPATSQLNSLLYMFGGAFDGDAASGLTKTVLLRTSERSQRVDKFMAQMGGENIVKDFKSESRSQALAVRLVGKFKTAFPDGAPSEAKDKGKEGEKKDEAPKADSLKASEQPSAVVLVGDSDMLFDHFCVQVQNFLGQKIVSPMNDNLTFVQNLVEHLSGDSNLISIRSRGSVARPFTVVQKMKADAEQKWKDKIKVLEDDVAEAQRKINELQRQKSSDQKFVLSKEQKETLENYRQKETATKKELKTVRKQLRREIDSLENKLKLANIALMPVLVSLGGILLAIIKRRRMVRK